MYLRNLEDGMNMKMLRAVEQVHYPIRTFEIDNDDFKPSILQIAMMAEKYIESFGKNNTVVFVDFIKKGETPFLLVYIWMPSLKDGFKQLVCTPGCRLSEEEEEFLVLACLDENTTISRGLVAKVIEAYNTDIPHTNIKLYKNAPLLSVLHMYFCMFRGIREILFKARLPYLASRIHMIDAIDVSPIMTKGRPVDLFGKGVTMRMLRLLNSQWGIRELMTEEKRGLAVRTYRHYSRMLGGYAGIGHSQWLYLKACLTDREEFEFDLTKFRFFGKDNTDQLFQDYLIFLAKKKIINRHMEWERDLTDLDQLHKYTTEADYLLSYVSNKDEYDHLIWTQNFRLQYLDYSDSQFIVTHPSSVQDIFDESMAQHNCLMSLYKDICRGKMDVGFMRKRNSPEKSFITFEVIDNKKVLQIFGKCNQSPAPKSREMNWFRSYMKKKGFELVDEKERIDEVLQRDAQMWAELPDFEEIPFM